MMIVGNLRLLSGICLTVLFLSSCMTHKNASPVTPAAQTASTTAPAVALPPVAPKRPYLVQSPHGVREDDYYWLRDDTRQSVEVIDYLEKENAYRDVVMVHTQALQQNLYNELVGRL